jgi:hypothetical protein
MHSLCIVSVLSTLLLSTELLACRGVGTSASSQDSISNTLATDILMNTTPAPAKNARANATIHELEEVRCCDCNMHNVSRRAYANTVQMLCKK